MGYAAVSLSSPSLFASVALNSANTFRSNCLPANTRTTRDVWTSFRRISRRPSASILGAAMRGRWSDSSVMRGRWSDSSVKFSRKDSNRCKNSGLSGGRARRRVRGATSRQGPSSAVQQWMSSAALLIVLACYLS